MSVPVRPVGPSEASRGKAGGGRRISWGVADQLASSATNVALTITVAGVLDRESFGAFALGYAVYLSSVGLMRSFTGEPFAVRFGRAEPSIQRGAFEGASGLSVAGGVMIGTFVLLVGLSIDSLLGSVLTGLGALLPGLLLQDTLRQLLLSSGRQKKAFINDLTWGVCQLASLTLLGRVGALSAATAVAGWGLSACLCAGLGILQIRALPAPGRSFTWLRSVRDLAGPFSGEFLVSVGAQQFSIFLVGWLIGLPSVGAVRATVTLYGPVNILEASARLVGTAEVRRWAGRSAARLQLAALVIVAALATGALLWGLALLLVPESVGRALFGDTWPVAQDLMLPILAMKVGAAMTIGPAVSLRVLERAKTGLLVKSSLAVLRILSVVVGATLFGLKGAVWAMSLVTICGSGVWWVSLHRQKSSLEEELR